MGGGVQKGIQKGGQKGGQKGSRRGSMFCTVPLPTSKISDSPAADCCIVVALLTAISLCYLWVEIDHKFLYLFYYLLLNTNINLSEFSCRIRQ